MQLVHLLAWEEEQTEQWGIQNSSKKFDIKGDGIRIRQDKGQKFASSARHVECSRGWKSFVQFWILLYYI